MRDMLNKFWKIIKKHQSRKINEVLKILFSKMHPELVEDFISILLNFMSFELWLDSEYNKNIEDFKGKYLFRSADNKISVQAIFKHSWLFNRNYLKVREEDLKDPDAAVIFKNSRALMNRLFSPKLDVLDTLLKNEVSINGNINYLFKFSFMATELRYKVLKEI